MSSGVQSVTGVSTYRKRRAFGAGGSGLARRCAGVALLLCATTCLTGIAHATGAPPPPPHTIIDGNGVDLMSGQVQISEHLLSIGPQGAGGLSYDRTLVGNHFVGSFDAKISYNPNSATATVSAGTSSDTFHMNHGQTNTYTPLEQTGASLKETPAGVVYTSSTGAIMEFSVVDDFQYPPYVVNEPRISKLTMPSGEVLTYGYISTRDINGPISQLTSVTSSLGYQIQFPSSNPNDTLANGVNLAVGSGLVVHDAGTLGRANHYDITANQIVITKPTDANRPGENSAPLTYTLYADGRVHLFSNGAGTWTYTYDPNGTTGTEVSDPMGHVRDITVDRNAGVILTDTRYRTPSPAAPSGPTVTLTTVYGYDPSTFVAPYVVMLTSITRPEGDRTEYTYDQRGNVKLKSEVPKPGFTNLHTLYTTATYDDICNNPKTCNQPNTVIDAENRVTTFQYDGNSGGVTAVTSPSPDGGTIQPETRYTYTQQTNVSPPVYRLTSTSTCQTAATCAGGGDEIVQKIDYGYGINLLPTAITTASGDASATAGSSIVTKMTYDNAGNLSTVDGPLQGNADTTRYYWDNGRLTAVVGPDPDGAGPSNNRAKSFTYNRAGQVIRTDSGVVDGQGDNALSSLATFLRQDVTYDGQGRKVKEIVLGGNGNEQPVQQSVKQYSWIPNGYLGCTSVRLNPATWNSIADPCAYGPAGPNGEDRITDYYYTGADELAMSITRLDSGGAARLDFWYEYTLNGKVDTVKDSNLHTTKYVYNGFDRLDSVQFPDPANGGAPNPNDYQAYGYSDAGDLIYERRRDGAQIWSNYDALHRLTHVGHSAGSDADRAYGYDNLGHIRWAAGVADVIYFGYDGLGRNYGEYEYSYGSVNQLVGWTYYGLDEAGRTAYLVTSENYDLGFQYDPTGEMTGINDESKQLVVFGYKNSGARNSIVRATGKATYYGYDKAWRLESVYHEFGGGIGPQTLAMTYNAADQITLRTSTKPEYVWGSGHNLDITYGIDALNRVTTVAGVPFSYNPTGTISSDGFTNYNYDAENHLVSVPPSSQVAGATLTYDPLDRLSTITTAAGGTKRFRYWGDRVLSQQDASGTMIRRWVWGPGQDEPLIEFAGDHTAEVGQWLHADERGSIVAVTNDQGAVIQPNTYDEYGIPSQTPTATNLGLFQYTGQMWLPEIGLYHYKARAYSPTLGRFLQPDPIGYAGGLNMYPYVNADPVNGIDPSGLCGTTGGRLSYSSDKGYTSSELIGTVCRMGIGDGLSLGGLFLGGGGLYTQPMFVLASSGSGAIGPRPVSLKLMRFACGMGKSFSNAATTSSDVALLSEGGAVLVGLVGGAPVDPAADALAGALATFGAFAAGLSFQDSVISGSIVGIATGNYQALANTLSVKGLIAASGMGRMAPRIVTRSVSKASGTAAKKAVANQDPCASI